MKTHFTPLVDFFSPELGSQYCVGLTYTIDDERTILDHETGEKHFVDAKLAGLVKNWQAEKKIRIITEDDLDPTRPKVSGIGEVVDTPKKRK